MTNDENDDTTVYKAVVNHEEQYSIWPEDLKLPEGWREAGKTGTKQECLSFIAVTWKDMTPLSLRRNSAQPASESDIEPTKSPDKFGLSNTWPQTAKTLELIQQRL